MITLYWCENVVPEIWFYLYPWSTLIVAAMILGYKPGGRVCLQKCLANIMYAIFLISICPIVLDPTSEIRVVCGICTFGMCFYAYLYLQNIGLGYRLRALWGLGCTITLLIVCITWWLVQTDTRLDRILGWTHVNTYLDFEQASKNMLKYTGFPLDPPKFNQNYWYATWMSSNTTEIWVIWPTSQIWNPQEHASKTSGTEVELSWHSLDWSVALDDMEVSRGIYSSGHNSQISAYADKKDDFIQDLKLLNSSHGGTFIIY